MVPIAPMRIAAAFRTWTQTAANRALTRGSVPRTWALCAQGRGSIPRTRGERAQGRGSVPQTPCGRAPVCGIVTQTRVGHALGDGSVTQAAEGRTQACGIVAGTARMEVSVTAELDALAVHLHGRDKTGFFTRPRGLGFPVNLDQTRMNIDEKILKNLWGVDSFCPPPSFRMFPIDGREMDSAGPLKTKKQP